MRSFAPQFKSQGDPAPLFLLGTWSEKQTRELIQDYASADSEATRSVLSWLDTGRIPTTRCRLAILAILERAADSTHLENIGPEAEAQLLHIAILEAGLDIETTLRRLPTDVLSRALQQQLEAIAAVARGDTRLMARQPFEFRHLVARELLRLGSRGRRLVNSAPEGILPVGQEQRDWAMWS